MKRVWKPIVVLLLVMTLLWTGIPAFGISVTGFPDVPEGAWYEQYLSKIIWAQQQVGQMNIISGLYNDDGELVFQPERQVKRGEWLKMLFEAVESSGNQTAIVTDNKWSAIHWAGKYYAKAQADNILIADVYTSTEAMFPCTHEALETPITRYEMAVILNNVCTNLSMQKTVIVNEPASHIADYNEIPAQYLTAVEQMYGKGLLTGYEDTRFGGTDTLTRAQAATVLYRYLFQDTINGAGLQEWASYPKVETSQYLDPSLSFAHWLNEGGHWYYQNGKTTLDNEARQILFGRTDIDHFSSAAQAADHMETVSVPVWVMDKSGMKYSSTCAITVNKAVAPEVKSIFQMIYDDPEQFPIYGGWSAGGARYTDELRHSWGCAIDINAYYNCECNTGSGGLKVTCGYGWWPMGHANSYYAGALSGQSPYSIGRNPSEYGYSVVKAFATYGWGWGGNGWSGGTRFDFMHFSVLSNGG